MIAISHIFLFSLEMYLMFTSLECRSISSCSPGFEKSKDERDKAVFPSYPEKGLGVALAAPRVLTLSISVNR